AGSEDFLLDPLGAASFAFGLTLPNVAGSCGRQLKRCAARPILALRCLVCDNPARQFCVNRSDPALGGIELFASVGVRRLAPPFEQAPIVVRCRRQAGDAATEWARPSSYGCSARDIRVVLALDAAGDHHLAAQRACTELPRNG